jgi:hypothetical protein
MVAFGKFTKPKGMQHGQGRLEMTPEQEARYETSLRAQEIDRQRESPESYMRRYGYSEQDIHDAKIVAARQGIIGDASKVARGISARLDPRQIIEQGGFTAAEMRRREEDKLLAESMRAEPLSSNIKFKRGL